MPKLFGMEPEQYKPYLYIGGGVLLLFIILRGRGQSGGETISASPPLQDTPSFGVSTPSLAPEVSDTQRAAEALQLQQLQQEVSFQKASDALHLQAQAMQLRSYQGQVDLEAAATQRQIDAIKSKPMSCPHGYEVRLGPDGKPYCRSKSGAITFSNVIVKPAADTIKQAIPAYVKSQLPKVG
jgi:hypothetical protein